MIQISAFEHPNIIAALAAKPEPYPGAVSLEWIERRLEDPDYCDRLGKPMSEAELAKWANEGAFEWPPESNIWYMPRMRGESFLLGRFPSKSVDAIWSAAWLEAARERRFEVDLGDQLELGIDPARLGDDSTALHARIRFSSVSHRSWRKSLATETAGFILQILWQLLAEFKPANTILRIDSSGGDLGAPLADYLNEQLAAREDIQVVEVAAGGVPLDANRFPNKRSELWFASAEYGRDGQLDLTRLDEATFKRLSDQLTAPIYKPDSRGRNVIEPKVDTKKRIGRSPDDADAFNLAYFGEFRGSGWDWSQGTRQRSRWGGREIATESSGFGAGRIERGPR